MKRWMVYLLAVALLMAFTVPSYAVEKKDKKDDKGKVTVKSESEKKAVKTASTQKPAVKAKPKYDNFVDANNNGIDDRKENLKKKGSSQQPAAKPKDTAKKESADSKKEDKK